MKATLPECSQEVCELCARLTLPMTVAKRLIARFVMRAVNDGDL